MILSVCIIWNSKFRVTSDENYRGDLPRVAFCCYVVGTKLKSEEKGLNHVQNAEYGTAGCCGFAV